MERDRADGRADLAGVVESFDPPSRVCWIAEEALAISLFCALRAESFEHGVLLAVNHSGDSDSTGSLTGQLLGTLWGVSVIPQRWLEQLELREVIDQVAHDLVGVAKGPADSYWNRYPGW